MANWSNSGLSSDDVNAAVNDVALWGGNVLTSDTVNSAEWQQDGTLAGSSEAASGFPESRAYDGHTDTLTKATSAQTTWYYLLDLTGSQSAFSGVIILNHNFSGQTVKLEVADSSDFLTNKQTLATWNPSDSNRLVSLDLDPGGTGTPQSFDTGNYARIEIDGSSLQPQFGELILLSRVQGQNNPEDPYNPDLRGSLTESIQHDGGGVSKYVSAKKRRILDAEIRVTGSTKIDEVTAWWDLIDNGGKNFVWVENPNSSPSAALLMTFEDDDPELDFKEQGPSHRILRLNAVEQGPDYQALE